MSGISWGVFQTLTTAYACEIAPTVLRPFVSLTGIYSIFANTTPFRSLDMCVWHGDSAFSCHPVFCGLLLASKEISAGVCLSLCSGSGLSLCSLPDSSPLVSYGATLCETAGYSFDHTESPWNLVRRNKLAEARKSLARLRTAGTYTEDDIDATLAYIRHTTEIETAETEGARFIDCFKGTNLRRTEIVQSLSSPPLCDETLTELPRAWLHGPVKFSKETRSLPTPWSSSKLLDSTLNNRSR